MGFHHDPDYINWVKYSINRLLLANVRTDGRHNKLYVELVKALQGQMSACSTKDGRVDRITQDCIIAINNVSDNNQSRKYISWVQTALLSLNVSNHLLVNGEMNGPTKEAIRKFQKSMLHKSIDGVVGPKTERDLANCVPDLKVPGYFMGGPVDRVKERQDDWLKNNRDQRSLDQQFEAWIKRMLTEIEDGESDILGNSTRITVEGMLRMFVENIYNHKYSDRYWYLPMQTVEDFAERRLGGEPRDHAVNAMSELRGNIEFFSSSASSAERYEKFKMFVMALYHNIDNGLRHIWWQIGNKSGVYTEQYAQLGVWHISGYRRKDSIIALFPSPEMSTTSPF